MAIDANIVRRGATIFIVAPSVVALLSTAWSMTACVWVLTLAAMIEWTAMKRHLKVVLLASLVQAKKAGATLQGATGSSTPPPPPPTVSEYPTPVAATNAFIVGKCLLCSLVCPAAYLGPSYFHFVMTCYFFFWVIFSMKFQNKAEHTAVEKQKLLDAATQKLALTPGEVFAIHEAEIIATQPITENFLSFALEYFGFVWVAGLAHSILLYCHTGAYGQPICTMVIVSNWCNDIAALITGKSMKGRTRPLYPAISPNKSLEGAVAGIIANAVAPMVIYGLWPDLELLDWGSALPPIVSFGIAGLFFGVLGVIGDLLQSLFKRSARIKDSGTLFPGHGGVLDRIDGLLLTYPVAYWAVWVFVNW
jgi:CDP-diglyceride synthetase